MRRGITVVSSVYPRVVAPKVGRALETLNPEYLKWGALTQCRNLLKLVKTIKANYQRILQA
jgi:hypothetical protein